MRKHPYFIFFQPWQAFKMGFQDRSDGEGFGPMRAVRENATLMADFAPREDRTGGQNSLVRAMKYLDGYVLPVPKKNLPAYRRMTLAAAKVWRQHDALEVRECIGDGLKVTQVVPFPQTLQLKAGETVVFSWIVFKSRADRDRVNAKVMKGPRLAKTMDMKASPFDSKRMVYGGFKTMFDARMSTRA
jgi:uncharacterized protein YbaA (DUF1428 family)